MTQADYKTAKRNIIILSCVMAALLLLTLAVFLRFAFQRDNPELSPQALVQNLEQSQSLYLKLDDTQYSLPAGEHVTGLFRELQETNDRPQEHEPWISLHFGELYEFYIYEGGIVQGFDGYAATATKTDVYYQADSEIYQQLKTHILTNGTVYESNLGFFK